MSTLAPRRFRWEIVYPPPGPKWFICPKTRYRMKRTAYIRRVPVIISPIQVKEKSPERVPDVESEEDLEEDPQENFKEEELQFIARSESKPKELEDTCESSVRPKLDFPKTIPAYMLPDFPSLTNNVNNANENGGNGNGGNENGENGGNNRGCTYKEFLTCKPRDLIEKEEEFKALLVEKFCPSNEIEKLETDIWNHAMVGANHAAYTNRFYELANLVPHLVNPESKRIERYIHELAPQIRGMIRATQPTTIQSAILKAGALTNEAVRCGTLYKSSEKRKKVVESSKQGGSWTDNKRANVGKGIHPYAQKRMALRFGQKLL
ncbi:hypothetical protein Tco_0901899 [Tanacetum coccineum]